MKGSHSEPIVPKNQLTLTSHEIRYLKFSWEMASSNIDVGCELVARLLNDSRTRFRALIESHSGDMLGSEIFTAESVKKIRRARSVGEGVVAFFSQIVSELDQPNALDLIKLQSQSLGASHFRMKVWFQAENWLCVKNCLLETIISGLSVKKKTPPFCGTSLAMNTKRCRDIWYRVIHYVIHNMKQGFLAEALSADTCSRSSTRSE